MDGGESEGDGMILDDIRRELAKARRDRARKRTVVVDAFGQTARLVVLVGNRDAYTAARMHEVDRALEPAELATFEGCEVQFGGVMGVAVEWRAA